MNHNTMLAIVLVIQLYLIPRLGKACTSFCLDNGGHPVFGCNLDFPFGEGLSIVNKRGVAKEGWQRGVTGKTASWVSKYGSVTFNLVSREYAWAGMNEAGLVFSSMSLPGTQAPAADENPPLDTGVWMQHKLDMCKTVEEVIAAAGYIRIITGDHYLLCDREGNVATLEWIAGKLVSHKGDALPVAALANDTYDKSLEYWRRSKRLLGNLFAKSSFSLRRFELASNRTKTFEPDKSPDVIEYAFDTLKEVSGQEVGGTDTQWSIVFDIERLTVHFRTRSHPDIRYFDIKSLDFRCSTPVKMLDINEKVSGNVAGQFIDYSAKTNVDLFYNFSLRYPAENSYKDLEWLTEYFGRYKCVHPEEVLQVDKMPQ